MTCGSGFASLTDAKSYFAQSLKRHLKESGYKGYQVAAAIGVANQTLSNWVSGRTFPDANNQIRLCKVLDVNIQDLYPPQDWDDLDASLDLEGLSMRKPVELDCLEARLIDLYRHLDGDGRKTLAKLASDMVASRHYMHEATAASVDSEGDS